MAVFSFWLRARAIAALGRFWSLHVEIRENHEFVKTGPFRWMRHPVYFSMILELASICLILHAPDHAPDRARHFRAGPGRCG